MEERIQEWEFNKSDCTIWKSLKKLGINGFRNLIRLYDMASKESGKGCVYFPFSDDETRLEAEMLNYSQLNFRSLKKTAKTVPKQQWLDYNHQYIPSDVVYTQEGNVLYRWKELMYDTRLPFNPGTWYNHEGKTKSVIDCGSIYYDGNIDLADLADDELDTIFNTVHFYYQNIGIDMPFTGEIRDNLLKKIGLYEISKENLISVENILYVVIHASYSPNFSSYDADDFNFFDRFNLWSVRIQFSLNFSEEEYIAVLEHEKAIVRLLEKWSAPKEPEEEKEN